MIYQIMELPMSHTPATPDKSKSIVREASQPRRPQAHFVDRAKKNVPVQLQHPHPLTWWRTRPAQAFEYDEILVLRGILKKSAIIGEPFWFLAARGDPAVAIGVALRLRRQGTGNPVAFDLAMSAVLCASLEDNAAAALLLSATLKCRVPIDAACDELSDSWLAETLCQRGKPRTRKTKHRIAQRSSSSST
jgi:hypothetical protein